MNKLGKYRLIRPLGEGATADVYLASDEVLQREVALKVLKPSLVADQASFKRFMQEARTAAGLFHPHIATVLEMDEAEGRYNIAMRYVDGPSKVLPEAFPIVRTISSDSFAPVVKSGHEAYLPNLFLMENFEIPRTVLKMFAKLP